MEQVLTKQYLNLPVNLKEVLRYLKAPDSDSVPGLMECINAAGPVTSFKVVYGKFSVSMDNSDSLIDFGVMKAESKKLSQCLKGCKEAYVFAATIGARFDRLIEKYKRISPSKSLIFQALGAERIETLCDEFCDDIKRKEERGLTMRFSPGYGDLDLSFQKEIFRVLNPAKNIGLTLNDSFLMTPGKSVTAIFGLTDEIVKEEHDCSLCPNVNCEYRKIL